MLFPTRWRERYGEEFLALLEDQGPSHPRWRDLARCLIAAHFEGRIPPVTDPTTGGGKSVYFAVGLLVLTMATLAAVFASDASQSALARIPELLEAMILILPVALAVALVRALRRDADRPMRAAMSWVAAEGLLLAVLGLVLVATLRPQLGFFVQPPFDQTASIEWRPFHDLLAATTDAARSQALAIIVGNLILFTLFGFAAALNGWRVGAVFLALVAVAIALEIGQAVLGTGRPSDVTAVLVRAVGGLLGYGLWRAPHEVWRTR
jgi:glycopeptide antibiotics resistance protein